MNRTLLWRPGKSGALGRLLILVLGAALVVLGVMFSVVLLSVLVLVGLAIWGYVWWRTRSFRRALHRRAEGRVVETQGVVVQTPSRERMPAPGQKPGSPSD